MKTPFGMVKMESLWMFIHVDSCSFLDWFKEFVPITVQFFLEAVLIGHTKSFKAPCTRLMQRLLVLLWPRLAR